LVTPIAQPRNCGQATLLSSVFSILVPSSSVGFEGRRFVMNAQLLKGWKLAGTAVVSHDVGAGPA
jgi:hypothetical protein